MKILGICGQSGSGKTTLLTKLIPILKAKHISVAVIKHSHHNMDIDKPGKDSYQIRQSGAHQTLVVCDNRWALMKETPSKPAKLSDLIHHFDEVDLVLVEGFKQEPISKLMCHRAANQKKLELDKYCLVIVTDEAVDISLPQFHINDIDFIVEFIENYLKSD